MTEGGRRWVLGLAVAALIPITAGAGCGGKDLSPAPTAGTAGLSAASGSAQSGAGSAGTTGISSGGGSGNTSGGVSGNTSGGVSGFASGGVSGTGISGFASGGVSGTGISGFASGGVSGTGIGGFASGGTSGATSQGGRSTGGNGTCCTYNDTNSCTPDGKGFMRCASTTVSACSPSGMYATVWELQACPKGCVTGIAGARDTGCNF